jgi:hypothetical protein
MPPKRKPSEKKQPEKAKKRKASRSKYSSNKKSSADSTTTITTKKSEKKLKVVQRRNLRKTNTTGYIGVTKTGNSFTVRIRLHGKKVHIGCYKKLKEAAAAHDLAIIKHNLPKTRLNFPDGIPHKWKNPEKNMKNSFTSNMTGFRGVVKTTGSRYQSSLTHNHQLYYLGTFDSPKEAAIAYDKCVIKLKLPLYKLNLPGEWDVEALKKEQREAKARTMVNAMEEDKEEEDKEEEEEESDDVEEESEDVEEEKGDEFISISELHEKEEEQYWNLLFQRRRKQTRK